MGLHPIAEAMDFWAPGDDVIVSRKITVCEICGCEIHKRAGRRYCGPCAADVRARTERAYGKAYRERKRNEAR